MSGTFSPSTYLRFVPRDDGWGAYHSLLGNASIIDDAGRRLLDSFSGGATIEEAASAQTWLSPAVVRSYANDLIIRGFLLPAGCDEYSLVERSQRLRKEHLQTGYLVRALQLVITNRCNYRCHYCFMDFQPETRTPAPEKCDTMSVDIADNAMRKLIALLRRNGNDMLNVELFGGEPLLNWPVIRHVLTTFGNEHEGIRILYSITTNGVLMTDEGAALLRRYGVTVTVSVDTPSKIEGVGVTVAKVGDRIRRSLTTLRDHGNAVTFNSVITKETIAYFDGRKLLDFARELNVQMVGLILDLDLPFYRNPSNVKRALEILLDTHRYGRLIGVPVGGYWANIFGQLAGTQEINLRSGYKTCPATGCKVSVEPDGSMFTCECTNGHVGNISDLDAVLASPAYADYAMRAYRHSPQCAGCEIEGFCSGVCMGSFENEGADDDAVEPGACQIFRGVTRDLIIDAPAGAMHNLRLERLAP